MSIHTVLRPILRPGLPWLMLALLPVQAFPAATGATPEALRHYFESLYAGAEPVIDGQRLNQPSALATFYLARDHEPVWTNGPGGGVDPKALLAAIEVSSRHGLNGVDYHQATLESLTGTPQPDPLTLELLASDALLQQIRHRSIGAVSPRELDPDWHLIEPEVNLVQEAGRLAGAGDGLSPALDELWPQAGEYWDLVAARERILAMGETDTVRVPPGPLLKAGLRGERVAVLKDRLLGPGDHTDLFDDDLKTAVQDFQRAAGLEPDGMVGDATLEVMNASRFSWIDRIDANLERWRWLPRQTPDTYVRVNIAAFNLRVMRAGEAALRMDVIVGRPYRRTPVFTESIKYLVFNPFWNVPYKLAVQDKLPLLKSDPARLAAEGYEVRLEGADRFVPVSDVDWSTIERRDFRHLLRQRPGPQNALGRVKFMLPNPHAVYLHDTPGRELFSKQERGFSSGCVRLSQPLELATWVLEHDGRTAEAARISAIVESGETVTVHLRSPLPTYLVYFTAFTDADREVVFRRDLYKRDAPLVAALRRGPSS